MRGNCLCHELLEKYFQHGGFLGFSGSGFTSGSTDTEEPACTFLSRYFPYLCAVCGSWKTSLKIFVICTGLISVECASGTSSIVFFHHIVGRGVPGWACRNTLENRRRPPERGFLVTHFHSSGYQLKGLSHPIHITTKC